MLVIRCAQNMKATLSFNIMYFPPENHYKEKFNVNGLLNEDSDMEKLFNHNRLLKGFSYVLCFVYFIHTVIVCYHCNKTFIWKGQIWYSL